MTVMPLPPPPQYPRPGAEPGSPWSAPSPGLHAWPPDATPLAIGQRPHPAPRDVTATARSRTSPQPCNPEAPSESLWHQTTTKPPQSGRLAMTSPHTPAARAPLGSDECDNGGGEVEEDSSVAMADPYRHVRGFQCCMHHADQSVLIVFRFDAPRSRAANAAIISSALTRPLTGVHRVLHPRERNTGRPQCPHRHRILRCPRPTQQPRDTAVMIMEYR